MTQTPGPDRSFAVYTDAQGRPKCVTGAGIIPLTAETYAALVELQSNLVIALDCFEPLGGIPVPVKQAVMRSMSTLWTDLFLAHIFHAIEHGIEPEPDEVH